MTLRLEDFPKNMQPYAKRNDQVYGSGTDESPYIGGWCVDGRSVSYNDEAKTWLKAHGFTHRGRRWLRTDNVGSE